MKKFLSLIIALIALNLNAGGEDGFPEDYTKLTPDQINQLIAFTTNQARLFGIELPEEVLALTDQEVDDMIQKESAPDKRLAKKNAIAAKLLKSNNPKKKARAIKMLEDARKKGSPTAIDLLIKQRFGERQQLPEEEWLKKRKMLREQARAARGRTETRERAFDALESGAAVHGCPIEEVIAAGEGKWKLREKEAAAKRKKAEEEAKIKAEKKPKKAEKKTKQITKK